MRKFWVFKGLGLSEVDTFNTQQENKELFTDQNLFSRSNLESSKVLKLASPLKILVDSKHC